MMRLLFNSKSERAKKFRQYIAPKMMCVKVPYNETNSYYAFFDPESIRFDKEYLEHLQNGELTLRYDDF